MKEKICNRRKYLMQGVAMQKSLINWSTWFNILSIFGGFKFRCPQYVSVFLKRFSMMYVYDCVDYKLMQYPQ